VAGAKIGRSDFVHTPEFFHFDSFFFDLIAAAGIYEMALRC
jgi:hypothetical protein